MKKALIFLCSLISFLSYGQRNRSYEASHEQTVGGSTFPVIETFTEDYNDASSASIDGVKPSGVQNDELILTFVLTDRTNTNGDDFDANSDPSGWTFVDGIGVYAADCKIGLFYIVANGSEGAGPYTFSPLASNSTAIGTLRISGVNTPNPIGVQGAHYSSEASTSHGLTGITTGNANSLAIAVFASDGADNAPFELTGTGWSKYRDFDNPSESGDGTEFIICTKEMASAGATGNTTITLATSENGTGFIFEIRSE